jgi:hypothetical protein
MAQRYLLATVAAFLLVMGFWSGPAWSVRVCDLNDPDRDVARLFPGSTRYETVTVEIQKLGGDKLLVAVETTLRDKLRGLDAWDEMIDMPYTVYVIYANNEKIGYIHGVNQKGRYGEIQIFLALDLDERIKSYYIQEITGPYAGKFRDAKFESQFTGLTLADFEKFDVATGQATGKVAGIKSPAPEAEHDFRRTLRGTKKNLILVNALLSASPELSAKSKASPKK